jgi:hypothetical protein
MPGSSFLRKIPSALLTRFKSSAVFRFSYALKRHILIFQSGTADYSGRNYLLQRGEKT